MIYYIQDNDRDENVEEVQIRFIVLGKVGTRETKREDRRKSCNPAYSSCSDSRGVSCQTSDAVLCYATL